MEFADVSVKESPGLCRCCLSEGCYKDMATEHSWMNETEIYADMLLDCFDISISQHSEGPNGPKRLICEVCITRLRDACNFKKQVVETEKKFVDMIGRGEFKPRVIGVELDVDNLKKEEDLPEVEDQAEEYLDDYDFGDGDDPDYLPQEVDDLEQPSGSNVTATALPSRKRGRPKKSTTPKAEKKAKVSKKSEEKAAKAVRTGKLVSSKGTLEISSRKRNLLIKENATAILEYSTAIPYKWQRHSYLCFFCHKPFNNIELLKIHTKLDHDKSSIKSAVSFLRRDEKVKIDVSDLSCRICNNTIVDFAEFIEHFQSHTSLNSDVGFGVIPYKLNNVTDTFECAICHEQFKYFESLNQHMNKHYGDYVCEICGKSFLSEDRLRMHATSHQSVLKCNLCTETFESRSQKDKHDFQIHHKLKCQYCDKSFLNYDLRKKHHHDAHKIELKTFDCSVCSKRFYIKSKMENHYTEVHLKEKNFSCLMCKATFFSQSHVRKHMIRHTGEKIHGCPVCMKSYARKKTLRDHMKKCHPSVLNVKLI